MAAGWGRDTWGSGAWGEPTATLVDVTGQAITSGIGSLTVIAKANIDVTGQAITSGLGGVSIIAKANIEPASQSVTVNLGSPAVDAEANVAVDGQQATAGIGTAAVNAQAIATLPGLSAGLGVAAVSIDAEANIELTGISSSLGVASVQIDAEANVELTGITSTLGVSSVVIDAEADVDLTGELITASLPSTTNEWTANNGAAISTAQSKFGGASLLLDGVNDNVISNTVYDFQSTAFTIEFWARPANVTQDEILLDTRDSTSNTSIYFRQAGTTLLIGRGTVTLLTVNNVFSANTWVSLAVTRGDPFTNTYTVFVDGNNEGSILLGASPTASDIHIGSDFNNTNNWSGYIDEIRLSDIDRYGGTSYTPATSEFSLDANTLSLLHLDGTNGSTSIIDEVVNDAVTIIAEANVELTGQQITSALGTTTQRTENRISVSGFAITAGIGTVAIIAKANVTPTGLQINSAVGKILIWSIIDQNQTPNYANIDTTQNDNWKEIAA